MSLEALLRTGPLFHDLSLEQLGEVVRAGRQETKPANTLIFAEGAQPDALYVILSGSLKVCRVAGEKQEVELARLQKGDFFGELALLEGGPRSASVTTLESCDLFVLGRDEFVQLLLKSPRSLLGLFSDLCARIRATNEKLFREALQKRDLLLQLEKERYQLLTRVATLANEAATFREAMEIAVEQVCTHTGFPIGHCLFPKEGQEGRLVSSAVWEVKNPERYAPLLGATEASSFGPGVGLPGKVLEHGMPVWVNDAGQDSTCPRAGVARELGLRAALGFPVLVHDRVEAVLEFFSDKPVERDEALLQVLSSIGVQLGQGLERRRYEEQLHHNAYHDALTDLPNRALFLDRLGVSLARANRRKDYLFAVIFLDLDRFKVVNDSLGHLLGDHLLIEMGRRLQSCLRTTDTVGRLGGDEFVLLLDEIKHPNAATRTVDRIRKKLIQPFEVDGHSVVMTASIGIALSSTGYDRPEDLLRDADIAMYRAKQKGTGLLEIFDSSMHQQALKLMLMENDLRKAVDRGQLCVHYQPILSLESREVSSLEALMRWSHPERGLIPPGEFIGLAEDTGLIIPMTHWLMHEVCQQFLRWQASSPTPLGFGIGMNLTSRHFETPGLTKQITDTVTRYGLEPGILSLEITESQIMRNPKLVSVNLTELSEAGIRVSIDDFGTGYSSLSYLIDFHVNALKIDRSFVWRLKDDYRGAAVALGIISLAQNLGLQVVAEGVETAEQADYLRAVKCGYAQGFYFFRPLDEQGITGLLAQRAKPLPADAAPLHVFEMFRGLGEEELAEISRNCEARTVPSDTLLIRQGQVGREIYLLQEGTVEVYRGEGATLRFLAVLQAPVVVGEMVFADRSRIRTANVRALDTVRLLAISVEAMLALMKRFPQLREQLRKLIAARM